MALWSEQYRPGTLDDYVWRDPSVRLKVEEWIAAREIPHVLFAGPPGTGKTSLAMLVLKEMKIPKGDILEINAARERKIEDVQDKVSNFVSCWSLGETGIKYVIFNEAEAMTPLAQKTLLDDIEKYTSICRFIFTANNPQRLNPAIHSRVQTFNFQTLDRDDFIVRIGQILTLEKVAFEGETLMSLVDLTYPDMRKCINVADQKTVGGVLMDPTPADVDDCKDYLIAMAELFKAGKLLEARKLLIASAAPEEYVDIYRYFYRNLGLWGDTEEQKDEALLVIRRGLVYDASVGDREINLSATMVELAQISQKAI